MINLTRFSGIARERRRPRGEGLPCFSHGRPSYWLVFDFGGRVFRLGSRVFESGSHVLNDLTAVRESEDHSPNMASYKQMRQ